MTSTLAEVLNRDCHCVSFDRALLDREAERLLAPLGQKSLKLHPSLFAAASVFLAEEHWRKIEEAISVIEAVLGNPAYTKSPFPDVPEIAFHPTRAEGIFFGYDFHLGEEGPKLIEINTNAGGALLNLLLARARATTCPELSSRVSDPTNLEGLEERFVENLQAEWARSHPEEPLRRVAIVDDSPEQQFLYPEFLLFRQVLRRSGIDAHIVDPLDLRFERAKLYHDDHEVTLVYNRLVDFYLEQPAHRALREAYLADAVVVTPHPRAHASHADKRHLVRLSDPGFLEGIGIDKASIRILGCRIPETRLITEENAEGFFREKKQWFFKPRYGYGSKAAYRGDKLTRATFEGLVRQGGYVAQRIVLPSERHITVDDKVFPLKLDLRCFVTNRRVELLAARLYRGQTTNFRTPGGGFASVYLDRPSPGQNA